MNYNQFTEFKVENALELLKMAFTSPGSISVILISLILLSILGHFSYEEFRAKDIKSAVSVSAAVLVIGVLCFGAALKLGHYSHIQNTAIDNIHMKYDFKGQIKLEQESQEDSFVYSGNYMDKEKNVSAQLTINVNQETGEPTIMQNALVDGEFISALERNK